MKQDETKVISGLGVCVQKFRKDLQEISIGEIVQLANSVLCMRYGAPCTNKFQGLNVSL